MRRLSGGVAGKGESRSEREPPGSRAFGHAQGSFEEFFRPAPFLLRSLQEPFPLETQKLRDRESQAGMGGGFPGRMCQAPGLIRPALFEKDLRSQNGVDREDPGKDSPDLSFESQGHFGPPRSGLSPDSRHRGEGLPLDKSVFFRNGKGE